MPDLTMRTMQPDAVQLSYYEWLYNQERATQDAIRTYREYYDGVHDTQLTDRQREYLQVKTGDYEFNLNHCPTVVDALEEKLNVTGFTTNEPERPPSNNGSVAPKTQAEQLWDWWLANSMDSQESHIHKAAVRDGVSYVLVEYDENEGRPVFAFEPYCVDGVGVKLHYSGEKRGMPTLASKRWVVTVPPQNGGGEPRTYRRLNLYYPDRVEKYASEAGNNEGVWQKWYDSEDQRQRGEWPLWWTDSGTESGDPLGIPVFPFANRGEGDGRGVSELRDVVPVQNALNKSVIDLLATADAEGFSMIALEDTHPPSDLNIGPGALLYGGKFSRLPAGNLGQLIELKDSFAIDIARVSRTPLSYFQISGQRPAEGTMKQEEAGLVSKANALHVDFGASYIDMMQMARRLHNVFGGGKLDEDVTITPVWADAQTRNEKEHFETLKVKREALKVPLEFIWSEAGYSADQIEKMKDTDEYRAMLAGQQMMIGDNLMFEQAQNA